MKRGGERGADSWRHLLAAAVVSSRDPNAGARILSCRRRRHRCPAVLVLLVFVRETVSIILVSGGGADAMMLVLILQAPAGVSSRGRRLRARVDPGACGRGQRRSAEAALPSEAIGGQHSARPHGRQRGLRSETRRRQVAKETAQMLRAHRWWGGRRCHRARAGQGLCSSLHSPG